MHSRRLRPVVEAAILRSPLHRRAPTPHPPEVPVPTPTYIPARWAASRAPGKLLRPWRGEPALLRAVRVAREAAIGPVTVLAGDSRVLDACRGWGLPAVAAFAPAINGSERIARAIEAGLIPSTPLAVNLQGDAVGATPEALSAALRALLDDEGASLGTVAVCAERGGGRTTVAVRGGRALDFARTELRQGPRVLRHVGIYAYQVPTLLRLARRSPGPRELDLSLEQLRWLEAGEEIAVAILEGPASLADAVDTEADFHPAQDTAAGRRAGSLQA